MTDPYTGPVTPEEVVKVVKALDYMGCYEISLGDTTGEGDPERWQTLWKALEKEGLDMAKFAAHVRPPTTQKTTKSVQKLTRVVS